MDIDDALRKVGGYRRWHLSAYAVISIAVCIPLATQGLNIVFIGYIPPHQCHIPPSLSGNVTVPVDQDTGQASSCYVYTDGNATNDTESCQNGWDYHTQGETSIAIEWDLVCSQNYLSDLTQVIFQFGAMIGDLAGASIADYFGRRVAHSYSYIFIAVFGIASAFSPNYVTFIILRIFIAIALSTGVTSGITLAMELFDSQLRSFAGIAIEVFWVSAYMLMALLGWLIQDWRKLQLVCSVLSLFGLLSFLIPESPLWLEANGRIEEAEEVLQKMARYNGVRLNGPLLFTEEIELNSSEKKKRSKSHSRRSFRRTSGTGPDSSKRETVLDLARDPLMLKFTLITSALWFCNSLVFYFMILSSSVIPGGRFFNFTIGGVAEIPAVFVSYYFVRYSRRVLTCVMHICAGVCLIILAFLPQETESGTDLTILCMCFALLGKFFISTSFNVVILYTRELYPTNLRAVSSGVALFLGRIGNMGAPFASYMMRSTAWTINVSLGALSVLVALATLLLPETKDWLLPQCIEDVYIFTRGRSRTRSYRVVADNGDTTRANS